MVLHPFDKFIICASPQEGRVFPPFLNRHRRDGLFINFFHSASLSEACCPNNSVSTSYRVHGGHIFLRSLPLWLLLTVTALSWVEICPTVRARMVISCRFCSPFSPAGGSLVLSLAPRQWSTWRTCLFPAFYRSKVELCQVGELDVLGELHQLCQWNELRQAGEHPFSFIASSKIINFATISTP